MERIGCPGAVFSDPGLMLRVKTVEFLFKQRKPGEGAINGRSRAWITESSAGLPGSSHVKVLQHLPQDPRDPPGIGPSTFGHVCGTRGELLG